MGPVKFALKPGRRDISDIEKILRQLEYVVDREAEGRARLWTWVQSRMRRIAGQERDGR